MVKGKGDILLLKNRARTKFGSIAEMEIKIVGERRTWRRREAVVVCSEVFGHFSGDPL